MASTNELYDELVTEWRKGTILASCAAQLSWDEQTYLPPGGVPHRSEQLSLLAGMVHDRFTAPRLGALIGELEQKNDLGEADGPRRANVREARRRYDRATKLPKKLVEEISRVTSLAQHNWIEARKKSQFETFRPWLEQVVALKREEAAALGSSSGTGNGVPYDALLDDYEPGAKTVDVAQRFRRPAEGFGPPRAGDPSSQDAPERGDSHAPVPQGCPAPRSPGARPRRSVFASTKAAWTNRPTRSARASARGTAG